MEHLFSPKSSGDLRSDAHQSQITRGVADEDHTQIIGGDTVKLLGGYIPSFPLDFGTPVCNHRLHKPKYLLNSYRVSYVMIVVV